MVKVLAFPVQSFCIPFLLPRQFYYQMMVNDIALFTGLRINIAPCEAEHAATAFHPRHQFRLVVRGPYSNPQERMIREKLQRYRYLAVALAHPRVRSARRPRALANY